MRFLFVALVVMLATPVAHADNDVPIFPQINIFAGYPHLVPSGFSTEPLPDSLKQTFDVEPIPSVQHTPDYPDVARTLHFRATVTAWVLVNTEGRVAEVCIPEEQVVTENGVAWKQSPRIFGQVTYDAVRLWRFTPAMHDGKPVEAWVGIPFQFGRTTTPH